MPLPSDHSSLQTTSADENHPQDHRTRRLYIDQATLSHQAAYLGRHYALDCSNSHASLTGTIRVEPLSGGLLLRHARVCNHENMRNRATLRGGIKLIMILEGNVDVRFAGRQLPAATAGEAALVNLATTTRFERRAHADTREASLTLTIPHHWFAHNLSGSQQTCCQLKQLPHLAMHRWQASPELRQWAAQTISNTATNLPEAQLLRYESLARAMVAEALPTLLDLPAMPSLQPACGQPFQCIQDLAESGKAQHMTTTQIANSVGMSPSTLQRHFKSRYGMSLQRYIRHRSLEQARRQLENEALSVTEIAANSGYTNPANFATAFKRQFGTSPTHYRQKHGTAAAENGR